MAIRPVFCVTQEKPYAEAKEVEFTYCSGFSMSQRQRCMENLHGSFGKRFPGRKVLEVSRASYEELGRALSAFRLTYPMGDGRVLPLEVVFQASKVFEKGGPYTDLLLGSPFDAKKDERLKNSGAVTGFSLEGIWFPKDPPTFFYDWIYCKALMSHPELHQELEQYDAFTDIMFNPAKQINCQAGSAALFVSLKKLGLLEKAMVSPEAFREIAF